NDYNNGYVVGNVGVPVWTDPAFLAANEAIRAKYVNVDLEHFQSFIEKPAVTIRLEEPFYCQELYAILDGVIQTVITDPQADPQVLLDQAVEKFQKEYLDKLGR
ncbi:MAG TPA: ABC transporter substrate-binding protein, partial [Firmicutes bacterium]|nr:ABC transporter substrate-binding protein [Bacillota bacterium]